MVGVCCCRSEHKDPQQQIVFDPVAEDEVADLKFGSEAKNSLNLDVSDVSTMSSPPSSQPSSLPFAREMSDAASVSSMSSQRSQLSHRSDSSLSSMEKILHKTRLQEMLKSFAKRALRGITCTLFTDSGELLPAKYQLDKRLQNLVMMVDDNFRVNCPMAEIRSIHQPEDGEHFFPKIVNLLNDEQKRRLLMISYNGERSAHKTLLFLENDTFDREQFLACIKILRLYSNSGKSSFLVKEDRPQRGCCS